MPHAKKSEKSYVVGEFQLTAANEIDIKLVCKDWSHLWAIFRHRKDEGDLYRLCKQLRKGSERTTFKSEISEAQAKELVSKLGLTEEFSPIFRRASTFRRIGYC